MDDKQETSLVSGEEDSLDLGNAVTQQVQNKKTTKILNGFRRKEKIATIFFNNEKERKSPNTKPDI